MTENRTNTPQGTIDEAGQLVWEQQEQQLAALRAELDFERTALSGAKLFIDSSEQRRIAAEQERDELRERVRRLTARLEAVAAIQDVSPLATRDGLVRQIELIRDRAREALAQPSVSE